MKELLPLVQLIQNIGGILLFLGVMLYATPLNQWAWIPYIIGSLAFCIPQYFTSYEGSNPVIKRLRKQQMLGVFLLLLSALLLGASQLKVLPFGIKPQSFLFLFLVGTIFEVYAIFRIPTLLSKEKIKQ